MFDAFALPRLGAGLTGQRSGPEAPGFFAGVLIVGGDETTRALIAAGGAGDHEVADSERSRGAVVVQMPIGHFGFPEQLAVEAVEGDHVGVVGEHEDAVACPGDPAVEAEGGVASDASGASALIVPNLAAGAGIERPAFVGARDVHDA